MEYFLMHMMATEVAVPRTAEGARGTPDGTNGRRSEIVSVASKSRSAGTLKSFFTIFKSATERTILMLEAVERGGPTMVSERQHPTPKEDHNPQCLKSY